MNLNIRPILSALLRNRTGAVLVALQIALALAILVNAAYIVKQRIDAVNRPTGMDDKNMFSIDSTGFTLHYDYEASVRADLAYLRGLDGVVDATVVNATPLSGSGSSGPLLRKPVQDPADQVWSIDYEVDQEGLSTFGTHLIAGRNFRAEEILPPEGPNNQERYTPSIIVTQALAEALFPHQNALGKAVYDPYLRPMTIIGIVANLYSGTWQSPKDADFTTFIPGQPLIWGFKYLVRTRPGRLNDVMRAVSAQMPAADPNRVIKSVLPLSLYKQDLYLSQRITSIFLMIMTAVLLAIAALGIFGLATFNVSTRTKQIGTRRAVGALKRDIIQHFLVENGLITTAGILIGCTLALAVGYELSLRYRLPRLDLYYLVSGVLVLWVVGQLAAWQPSRRAASVPPSVATRTA